MKVDTLLLILDGITWNQTLHTEHKKSLRIDAAVHKSGRDMAIDGVGPMAGIRVNLAVVRGYHDWQTPGCPKEAIGYISYFGESAEDDFGEFLSGGFSVPEELFDDVWQRLKLGGHSTAIISLKLGPFDFDGFDSWIWKRSASQFLFIHQAEFTFVREEGLVPKVHQ